MEKIDSITIVGANGTLGTVVTGIFASFGKAKVYMVSRTKEKSEQAIRKACSSVKANSIKDSMIAKSYDDLEECLKNSDLVLECIIEDLEEKRKMHYQINKLGKDECIYSSVTSGISINELAKCYDAKKTKNFIGIHFFNPPYSLQLCEVIPAESTSEEVITRVTKYLEEVLFRKVIQVKDKAGFLANRIGFQFINKALQYAEKYKDLGGIDYIDTILGCFTGRNMPPILTADFVGLDVHKAIVDNIYEKIEDENRNAFILPNFVQELIDKKKLGKKVGEGFYQTDELKNKLVYDIEKQQYRKILNYDFKFVKEMIKQFKIGEYEKGIQDLVEDNSKEAKICLEFMKEYIQYSFYVASEVGESLEDADTAMAEGFNWIPPIALLEALKQYYPREEIGMEKVNLIKSKYDYRKYLKAKGW